MRRSRREHRQKYIDMLKMLTEAGDMIRLLKLMREGKDMVGNIADIHWDLLQVGHVNL